MAGPGVAEPLARAIVELGTDLERARRLGEAGRRRALEEFLEERCIARTELLYESVLNRVTVLEALRLGVPLSRTRTMTAFVLGP